MATQHRIRSAFFHEGKSISVIAREFDIDRKTVRKYIERDDWNETADTVPQGRPSVMDPFLPMIELWLTEDRDRRRKQRHTARRVFDRLVTEHEFTGSYRTVAMHVRDIRSRVFQESRPALPLQHIPGEAQADFGEADWLQNGARVHGSYLVLSFPASNAGFLQLTPGQNQECLFEALLTLFDAVGGVPRRIWFDNASTMVRAVLKNGGRELTDGFRRFQEHLGFEAAFCNPASGNEKGNVENKVGYLRRNLLVPEPVFHSLDAHNAELIERCRLDHNRAHYRSEKTIHELFAADVLALLLLPRIPFDPARYETVSTDSYGFVALNGGRHRYSSAPSLARSRVRVKITAQTVSVLDESHRTVVVHDRIYGNLHDERIDWIPYLTQLSRRPTALKYTAVYDMMPQELQQWLGVQPRDAVGTALSLLASLTKTAGFESACQAVTDSLAAGITDADSLVALHDRISRLADIMPRPLTHHHIEDAHAVVFRPERYDQMLSKAVAG
jgi:transposase